MPTKRGNAAECSNDGGYTLLEVVMAMAIFAIGMLAVASLQVSSTSKNATSGSITVAATWAADRMEALMHMDYSNPNLVSQTPGQAADAIDNDSDGEIDESNESGPISIRWTVETETLVPNTKTITVIVTTPTRRGARAGETATQEVSLTFIKMDQI